MERKQKCSAPPLIIKSMRLLPKSKMPPILRNAPNSPYISHHLLYPPPCPSRLRSLCPWTSNTCMTHFTNTETSRPLIPHEPRLLSSVVRVHAFLFSNTKSRMMDWRASRRHCPFFLDPVIALVDLATDATDRKSRRNSEWKLHLHLGWSISNNQCPLYPLKRHILTIYHCFLVGQQTRPKKEDRDRGLCVMARLELQCRWNFPFFIWFLKFMR